MTFAVPTKLVSEAGTVVEYLGVNKVQEWQKIFQVQLLKLLAKQVVVGICMHQ